jgi:hypothetical protein
MQSGGQPGTAVRHPARNNKARARQIKVKRLQLGRAVKVDTPLYWVQLRRKAFSAILIGKAERGEWSN